MRRGGSELESWLKEYQLGTNHYCSRHLQSSEILEVTKVTDDSYRVLFDCCYKAAYHVYEVHNVTEKLGAET